MNYWRGNQPQFQTDLGDIASNAKITRLLLGQELTETRWAEVWNVTVARLTSVTRQFDRWLDRALAQGMKLPDVCPPSPLLQEPALHRSRGPVRAAWLAPRLLIGIAALGLGGCTLRPIYQEQVRLAQTSEEIRVRLILSRTKPEADAVIGILGQGASFEAVAMERSIDEATRFSGVTSCGRTMRPSSSIHSTVGTFTMLYRSATR